MVNYICPNCKKEFYRKSNYDNHTLNKKNPCDRSNFTILPLSTKSPPKSTEPPPNLHQNPPIFHQNPPKSSKINSQDDLIELLVKEPEPNANKLLYICCRKKFTRSGRL